MGRSVVFAARRDITRSGENTPSRRETRPAGHFGGEGGSIGDVELVEHVAQMGVDGVRRDVEAAGNFFVGEAFGDELGDGELRGGEALPAGGGAQSWSADTASHTEAPQFRAGPCGPGWGAHGVVVLQRFEEQGLRLFLASGGREDRYGILARVSEVHWSVTSASDRHGLEHQFRVTVDEAPTT